VPLVPLGLVATLSYCIFSNCKRGKKKKKKKKHKEKKGEKKCLELESS
jgi:hypothetical protein